MRALMGIGGAFIMPSTLSILDRDVPRARARQGDRHLGRRLRHRHRDRPGRRRLADRARATGAGSSSSTCRSWPRRWSPGACSCPRAASESPPQLDLRGFTLSFAALTTLIWGLIEAPARGWTDGARPRRLRRRRWSSRVAFVAWERRAPSPMLDIELFRNPRFTASSAAISLAFFALFGMIFFLTQYMQMVRGYDALERRHRDAAGRRRPRVRGPVLDEADREARAADRRPARARVRRGRHVPDLPGRRDVGLRADRRRARAARLRHRDGDGARHRRDHGRRCPRPR